MTAYGSPLETGPHNRGERTVKLSRYEIVRENIESGSKVMDGIAEDSGDFFGHLPSELERYPWFSGVHVDLEKDCTRITLKIGGKFSVKLCDVTPSAHYL